jgi:hypothetical protein
MKSIFGPMLLGNLNLKFTFSHVQSITWLTRANVFILWQIANLLVLFFPLVLLAVLLLLVFQHCKILRI